MRRDRTKWQADRGSRAIKRITDIEATIAALNDDDLLDLADIFVGHPRATLSEIAAAEMAKRKIGL